MKYYIRTKNKTIGEYKAICKVVKKKKPNIELLPYYNNAKTYFTENETQMTYSTNTYEHLYHKFQFDSGEYTELLLVINKKLYTRVLN